MTLEELKTDPLFRALTDKQQRFVIAYAVEGKDHITAATEAYKCNDRHKARAAAGSALRNTYVQAVVARYSGGEVVNRHQFEIVLWKTINSMKGLQMKKDLLLAFGKMKGFLNPETPEEPTTISADFLAEFKEA